MLLKYSKTMTLSQKHRKVSRQLYTFIFISILLGILITIYTFMNTLQIQQTLSASDSITQNTDSIIQFNDHIIPSLLLTQIEFNFILQHISSIKHNFKYLEFGTGLSTLYFGLQHFQSILSIESSSNQCNKTTSILTSTPNFTLTSTESTDLNTSILRGAYHRDTVNSDAGLTLICAPIEKGFRGWNREYWEGNYKQFEAFVNAPFEFLRLRQEKIQFDVVLIHSNARLSCAFKVLEWIHHETLVIIPDFHSRHELYGKMLDYYDILDSTQRVAILKIKPNIDLHPFSTEFINEIESKLPKHASLI
mmetsp:Transcript_4748/g.8290  ORF Transcript_4748/g.8290 Transcript_4748/m.8290 type:complete len:306 (-) Transcript_4748:390-1307(-)